MHTGLQIVGLVTIIKGIVNLIAVCGTILANQEMMLLGLHVSAALAPTLMVAAGVFLIIGSKGWVEKLYPDNEEKPESGEALFILAMKVLGAVLIVQALPDAVQILSNLVYLQSVSPIWNTDVQKQFVFTHLLSTLLYFIFGWYLLKGGHFLIRMAFKDTKDDE